MVGPARSQLVKIFGFNEKQNISLILLFITLIIMIKCHTERTVYHAKRYIIDIRRFQQGFSVSTCLEVLLKYTVVWSQQSLILRAGAGIKSFNKSEASCEQSSL